MDNPRLHGAMAMKCIKDGVSGEVRRVPDETAAQYVRDYPAVWRYCSKEEWRAKRG
jgi:hypothetical protein